MSLSLLVELSVRRGGSFLFHPWKRHGGKKRTKANWTTQHWLDDNGWFGSKEKKKKIRGEMKSGKPTRAVCGGGGVVLVHGDTPPPGNMWLAQYLNASDKLKNTPGLFGKNTALWRSNGESPGTKRLQTVNQRLKEMRLPPVSIRNTARPVSSTHILIWRDNYW